MEDGAIALTCRSGSLCEPWACALVHAWCLDPQAWVGVIKTLVKGSTEVGVKRV